MPMGGNGKDQIERRKASEMKAGWHVVCVSVCVCVCQRVNYNATGLPAGLRGSRDGDQMLGEESPDGRDGEDGGGRKGSGAESCCGMEAQGGMRIKFSGFGRLRYQCEDPEGGRRREKEGEGGRRRALMLSGQMNELVMNDMEKEQDNRRPAGRD